VEIYISHTIMCEVHMLRNTQLLIQKNISVQLIVNIRIYEFLTLGKRATGT